ncbi:ParB/RepB/Spo0J family partition protein [Rubrivirga litoralis]|uniref:ParB/RepB/Spo0J family partition protein n=1 Tax=Rubrivirga litoralis TaxID=3075598 RepID=A0ABU3BS85_9BACT|nr:ParB/RepB/Spo0J family partition protein [Rubrivirga sp. F394]MDT0632157.1 ParB/RepB/Spo0J family partition protein [Rubrivirga sp. F394]
MATKKAALGKGLSALLPQQPSEPGDEGGAGTRLYNFEERRRLAGRVADLEVEAIRPNPYQPRKDFDEDALDELAASVRQLGIIQPLTVRALGDGRYELISGERRLRASRRAGLTRVPCYVREADTEEMLEMAIVENVQREDLNPVEVALGYQRLMEEVGLTQEQVAEKVGKSRPTVANALRLLRLPPRVQASLREGALSSGHARSLVGVEDPDALLALHRATLDEGLSVREVERRARALREGAAPEDAAPPAPSAPAAGLPDRDRLQVEAMEARLRDRVASQVRIRHRDDGGTIEIAYYSVDDLERVVDRLLGD